MSTEPAATPDNPADAGGSAISLDGRGSRRGKSRTVDRIVEAMRMNLRERGAAAATFDQVAKDAGVSRGLVHYYFETREDLMAEVVRRDSDPRAVQLTKPLARAKSTDDVVDAFRGRFDELVGEEFDGLRMMLELLVAAQRDPELRDAVAKVYEHRRIHIGAILEAKEAEGVLVLPFPATDVVSVLYALAQGIALQRLSDPERDFSGVGEAGAAVIRLLFQGEGRPDEPAGP